MPIAVLVLAALMMISAWNHSTWATVILLLLVMVGLFVMDARATPPPRGRGRNPHTGRRDGGRARWR